MSGDRQIDATEDIQPISRGLLASVADWIMDAAIVDKPIQELLGGVCVRLLAAGVPIDRAHISYRTLHPAVEAVSLLWQRGEEVRLVPQEHGAGNSAIWRRSPFFYMIENDLPTLRRRLIGDGRIMDFLLLEDLVADGVTDYLALNTKFDGGVADMTGRVNGLLTSWATKRPSGFAEADIAALLRVKQRLAVAAKLAIRKQIAENVVDTYLGHRAGSEVLSGHIQRGDGRNIHAVVWYSDLRGSSELADRMPASRYIALLNGYFECAAGAVVEAGGEVLNYIGDSVLAVFPIDGEDKGRGAAEAAFAAANEARRRLGDVNENLVAMGADPLDFGVGLHAGHVVFGNIGAGARLAFTTIGAAVNEVARIEEASKELQQPILASGAFRAMLGEASASQLEARGLQKLRGIGAPIDLYGLFR